METVHEEEAQKACVVLKTGTGLDSSLWLAPLMGKKQLWDAGNVV